MNYNKAFKLIRKSRNLTQKQIGEYAGVSPGYISKIEKGEKVPTLEVIEKVCSHTDVPFPVFAMLSSNGERFDNENGHSLDELKLDLLELLPRDSRTRTA